MHQTFLGKGDQPVDGKADGPDQSDSHIDRGYSKKGGGVHNQIAKAFLRRDEFGRNNDCPADGCTHAQPGNRRDERLIPLNAQ